MGLVRQLSGTRRRVRPSPLAVLRDESGTVLEITASVAEAWQRKFLREFGGDGVIVVPGDIANRSSVAFVERARVPAVWTQAQWADALFAAAGRLKQGTAGGPDLLPPELFRARAWPCARVLAGLAELAFTNGVPTWWRGGSMAPVPKQPKLGLTLENPPTLGVWGWP